MSDPYRDLFNNFRRLMATAREARLAAGSGFSPPDITQSDSDDTDIYFPGSNGEDSRFTFTSNGGESLPISLGNDDGYSVFRWSSSDRPSGVTITSSGNRFPAISPGNRGNRGGRPSGITITSNGGGRDPSGFAFTSSNGETTVTRSGSRGREQPFVIRSDRALTPDRSSMGSFYILGANGESRTLRSITTNGRTVGNISGTRIINDRPVEYSLPVDPTAFLNPDSFFERLDDAISQSIDSYNRENAPPPASEEAIRKLARRKATQEDVDANHSCPICMEEFKVGEEINVLPCGHLYHLTCVEHWLRDNGTCPTCRERVDRLQGPQADLGSSNGSHRGSVGPSMPSAESSRGDADRDPTTTDNLEIAGRAADNASASQPRSYNNNNTNSSSTPSSGPMYQRPYPRNAVRGSARPVPSQSGRIGRRLGSRFGN